VQNLYGRAPSGCKAGRSFTADTNYRSPREILDHLNRLLTLDRLIDAASALSGSEVEILTYADTAGLIAQTLHALDQPIAAGIRKDMIAVVSFRGRENEEGEISRLGPGHLHRGTANRKLLAPPEPRSILPRSPHHHPRPDPAARASRRPVVAFRRELDEALLPLRRQVTQLPDEVFPFDEVNLLPIAK